MPASAAGDNAARESGHDNPFLSFRAPRYLKMRRARTTRGEPGPRASADAPGKEKGTALSDGPFCRATRPSRDALADLTS